MSNSKRLDDVRFRFEHQGGDLWVAISRSRWGPVEFLVRGSEERPDQANLDVVGRFLADAGTRVLALRRELRFPWLYRPIRVAINNEGRIGVQFQNRLWRRSRPLIQEETAG